MPVATDIHLRRAERLLDVSFDDGTSASLPAEYLRVESPSAEVQGHGPSQRKTVPGRRYVGIMTIEPVGHYAIRITFDDLHDTGIYSWDFLHQLGREQPLRWSTYLQALEAQGLTREPR